MNRDEWLAERRKGIGASDIPQICGLTPWGGPRAVWNAKVLGDEAEENEAMYWGRVNEPNVAERFELDHPEWNLSELTSSGFYARGTDPVSIATLDAVLTNHAGWNAVLEIKTTSAYSRNWAESGTSDGVPEYVRAQVIWQMGVCRYERAYVAVLVGGNQYREYPITWDPETWELLLHAGRTFWKEHVLTKDPPPPDDESQARELYPHEIPRAILEVDAEIAELISEADLRNTVLETQAKRVTQIRARLMDQVGEYDTLAWPDGVPAATWRTNKSGAVGYKGIAEELRRRLRLGEKRWNNLKFKHTSEPSRVWRWGRLTE